MTTGHTKSARRRRTTAALLLVLGVPAALAGLAFVRHHSGSDLKGELKGAAKSAYHQLKAEVAGSPAQAAPPAERADGPLRIYEGGAGGLAPGWQDWSWTERDLNDSSVSRRPGGKSIRMAVTNWKGLFLHHDQPIGVDGYGAVQLLVKDQKGKLTLTWSDIGSKLGKQVVLEPTSRYATRQANGWVAYRVPLEDIGVQLRKGWQLTGFAVQDGTGKSLGSIYLDSIALLPDETLPATPTTATVAVSVDATAQGTPISPYIYGMSFAPTDYLSDLKLTVNRWGGNDKSRYNWQQGNACNAARDWEWRNRKAVGDVPSGPSPSLAADTFVRTNRDTGAVSLLTIPTLGWVARNEDNNDRSEGVPGDGAAPLRSADGPISGYDPAQNRTRTSVRSVARAANAKPSEVAQDAWVRHLTKTFGPSDGGGVRFYAMDNEPDLWQHTHTDVHPARMGYDDLLSTFYQYASAVKDADPSAQITGPVSWGWTGYLYSPLDQGSDNYHTFADRKAHGGDPFLLWFLKQVRAKDGKAARRTLDVLDIHFYPQAQGVFTNGTDQATRDRRLRSVRALWDPSYSDESWIGEPVRLIPRMKEWISQGYPGTKIGLTEWNFGADADISGGLATAEALGIFGRDGVYLANYWAYPGKNTPAYLAFKLMRNADGAGHGFGDRALPVKTQDNDRLACFAAKDAKTGELTLLLLNKMRKATITAPVTLGGISSASPMSATRYSFSAAAPGSIATADGLKVAAGKLLITLPPYSATLIRIKKTNGGGRAS